jgi:hypothetical protein
METALITGAHWRRHYPLAGRSGTQRALEAGKITGHRFHDRHRFLRRIDLVTNPAGNVPALIFRSELARQRSNHDTHWAMPAAAASHRGLNFEAFLGSVPRTENVT